MSPHFKPKINIFCPGKKKKKANSGIPKPLLMFEHVIKCILPVG